MTSEDIGRVFDAAYQAGVERNHYPGNESHVERDAMRAALLAVATEAARREREACAALVRRMADPVRDSCAAADVVTIYDQIADMLEARNG